MGFKEIIPGLTEMDVHIERDGFDSFLSAWLIRDKARGQTILADMGPASSIPKLCADLKGLGAGRIDYLIFTHIHLDHSGGVGQFHEQYPDTKIIAPQGARAHLIAPDKLFEASLAALGASLVGSYGKPLPLPSSAFTKEMPDGLTEIPTPGHAPFHNAYLYEMGGKRILFPGEAAGFFCKLPDGGVYQRPATPHKFFYDTAMESIDRLLSVGGVDIICYPHYGCAVGAEAESALKNAKNQLMLWKKVISAFSADESFEKIFAALCEEDGLLRGGAKLKETGAGAERERFFIWQSIRGFMGYIFK